MTEQQVKLSGPGHSISIKRNPDRAVISVGCRAVADIYAKTT